MKKNSKIKQEMNKSTVIVICALFFFNLLTVSANSRMEVKSEKPIVSEMADSELRLENWMLNSDLFLEMLQNGYLNTLEDQEIMLEPWMLDHTVFNEHINFNSVQSEPDIIKGEEEVKLETWMLDIEEYTNLQF